jgi:chromosome segregation ATPase
MPGAGDTSEANQFAAFMDERERQLGAQEEQLHEARAAFRRERDTDRGGAEAACDEAERLRREARALQADAARTRDRTRRLAFRYARHLKQKWADVKIDLDRQRAEIEAARQRFAADVARFQSARSDFHISSAEEAERQREGWESLETHRKRMSAEWTEATEFFAKQEAALAQRAKELAAREEALGGARGKLEQETAALRTEAAGLEVRVQNARAVVEELERRRDQVRAELLGPLAPPDPKLDEDFCVALDRRADRDLTQLAAELDAREKFLNQEKGNLAALRASLEKEVADLTDRRRVLNEQFVMLANARGKWQEVEHQTMGEMEQLARKLGQREQDLDGREARLASAESRRREDAYDLWQLRLKLEAWQSKLTTVERQWHAERERRDADYAERLRRLTHRETEIESLFTRWERVRDEERGRLQVELRLWSGGRERLAQAAADYDSRAREVLGELLIHAARAMASEDLLQRTVPDAYTSRRFRVLQRRWERAFRQKLSEIDARRARAQEDFARLDERYQELHRSLEEAMRREAEFNSRAARADVAEVLSGGSWRTDPGGAVGSGPHANPEMDVLREEYERMAAVLLEAGAPEVPDGALPWAAEEVEAEPDVLHFTPRSRAA